MQIYLPIAELPVNVFLILGIGGGVGFLSGLFGVGGGFLMTPLLMLIGIPPAVAVASGANQAIASSVSGVIAHWRRGNVDLKMGTVLFVSGLFGSSVGVWLFTILRNLGQVDLVITFTYVVLLSIIGTLMLNESIGAIIRRRRKKLAKRHRHYWVHGLPLKVRFRKSLLYISVLLPISVGFFVGVLSAILGVGGGFVVVPAMIYLFGMPTAVVVGTSLFQIIFVTANVTVLQATANQTVDVVLAMLLTMGGVIGAQIGARMGAKLQAEYLRGLLAMMVLVVCASLAFGLIVPPADPYSLAGSVHA
jgi:uncharacterized membrane protein YfcA